MKLEGVLDIGASAELRQALREFLAGAESLSIELSGVEACDCAGIQLLCSVRKTAGRGGRQLPFTAIPDPVTETAAALGLSITAI